MTLLSLGTASLLLAAGPSGVRSELTASVVKAAEELEQDGAWNRALSLIDATIPVVDPDAALKARLQTAKGSVLLAQARRQTGRFDLAQAALEEARRTAEASADAGARGNALSELGMAWYWNKILRGQGSFDAPKALFQEAEKLFRTAGDAAGEGRALFRQGLVAQFSNLPDEEIRLLRRSLALAERAGDRRLMAEDHRHLGAAYEMMNDLVTALEHFEESLKIRRSMGGKLGLAPAIQAVADTRYAISKDATRSSALLEEALAIATEQDDMAYVAAVEISLAHIDSDAGRRQKAQERLLRAVAAARKVQDGTTEKEAQDFLSKLRERPAPDGARNQGG